MKLIDFYSLYYLLSSYLDSSLPARASFAIAKFIVSNESSYKLYLSKRAELISKYADKDEKGELIVDTWESRKLVSSGEVSVRGIYGYV